jgi:hypothetical protein
VSIISLLSFVIIAVVGLRNYYFDQAYSRSIGYREMAAHVAREAQPDDLFLAHFPDPALVYYLRHVNIDYEMQPARFQPPAAETETALAALTAAYDRVWFVPHASSFWDRENVVPNWLALNTLKEQDVRYNQLSLFAIRPSHALAAVTHPIGDQLGDSIRLEAVLVTADGLPVDLREPVPVRPGTAVTVNLIWEAVESITAHYTVFVQLLDENGLLVAQHDGVPVDGGRPTTTWQSGERLIDTHTLTIPPGMAIPPGTAATQGQIIVGMYRTETVERLLFADGRDATTIVTVQFVE